jgi:putative redox protein
MQWSQETGLFAAETGAGHRLVVGPGGGRDGTTPSPMEALMAALGGCTGIDIVSILEKMRLTIDKFSMEITGERADTEPKYFTKLNVHYMLTGENLDAEKVKRAVQLSAEKYCSVAHSLKAEITHTITLNGQQLE